MNQPIIFLDFDGVLNSLGSTLVSSNHNYFSPISIGLMQRLAVEADARIVVSSAWRIGNDVGQLKDILLNAGGNGGLSKRVMDKTGRSTDGIRGKEIAEWLNTAGHKGRYVIIDDDSDMLPEQLSNFVQTTYRDGFGVVEYVKALSIIAPEHADVKHLRAYVQ